MPCKVVGVFIGHHPSRDIHGAILPAFSHKTSRLLFRDWSLGPQCSPAGRTKVWIVGHLGPDILAGAKPHRGPETSPGDMEPIIAGRDLRKSWGATLVLEHAD